MTAAEYNQSVRDYADRVYRFAIKICNNQDDAKDVVQSAFEKLWLNHSKVDVNKSRSYLFTCAYHQMIDDRRKNGRVVTLDQSHQQGLVSSHSESFEARDTLELAFRKLDLQQKELILLRDYEGYSYKEIAEISELSESQVKVYLFRARKKMQESIKAIHGVAKIG